MGNRNERAPELDNYVEVQPVDPGFWERSSAGRALGSRSDGRSGGSSMRSCSPRANN